MTTKSLTSFPFQPAARLSSMSPYTPGERFPWIDLFLDANEGPCASDALISQLQSICAEDLRRYPSASALECAIAERHGIEPSRVIVTNGGDDAIDRVCRVSLEPGRSLVTHTPTFEMIARSAKLAGGQVCDVPWFAGDFPVRDVLDAISPNTGLVAIVSPNNPTGCVVSIEDIELIAETAQVSGAIVLVDLAYVEFADEDPTSLLIKRDNVVLVRTFSKAFGLAGLRVGYAIAPETVSSPIRAAGGPYPVSTLSLRAASAALTEGTTRASVETIRSNRKTLAAKLGSLGCELLDSQANFLFVRTTRAEFLWRGLASLGIAVRRFTGRPDLTNALRITVPAGKEEFARLDSAIEQVLSPQAILFDVDGVLADVGQSYREAIIQTAQSFGVAITQEEIQRVKDAGDANNDWIVTHRLLSQRGIDVSLEEVTARFQRLYLGVGGNPGLRDKETLIPSIQLLRKLAERFRLGIVTGRPRGEAEWFLEKFGIADLFPVRVCMEDAPAKPSPEPVRIAMESLGARSCWMIGDTPDDIVASRIAGVVPIGISAPGLDAVAAKRSLTASGAAAVLVSLDELKEILP